ncbi:uncharacterized protein LOC134822843 [Bolinopsis microptera]|uniref:uncharacterized protein LOC134822843 n=1 Tax=Bolinopsis microptera TaxID=2820187 RepID=UPI00307958A8
MAGGSDHIVEYIEKCGDFKTFTLEAYSCVQNYVCNETDIKTTVSATEGFDPVKMLPFEDFCGLSECYKSHVTDSSPLTDIEQPCFRYRCIEGTPLYVQYSWCGYDEASPQKLILPLVLIGLLCAIIFYMAFASCRERSQRIKYIKSQNSYGKLKDDQANNKH